MDRNRWPLVVLLTVLLLDIISVAHYGRFTGVDEIAFKGAGRQWAAEGVFANPELENFKDYVPPVQEVWFGHLPLYTLGFGLFSLWAGFGSDQSTLYDALIHALYCLLTYAITRRAAPEMPHWVAAIAGLVLLPVTIPGRPDELATCFGMLGFLILWGHWPGIKRWLAAAILIGIAAATSIVAGAVSGLVLLVAGFIERPRQVLNGKLVSWVVVAFLSFALGIAYPLIIEPRAVNQFLHHSGRQFGLSLVEGWILWWTAGASFSVFAALFVVGLALASVRKQCRTLRPLSVAVAAALVLLAIALPPKYYYLSFLLPWLVSLGLIFFYRFGMSRPVLASAVYVAIALAAISPLWAKKYLMWTLPDEQRLSYNVERILERVPEGSRVMTNEYWAAIGNRYHVLDLNHSNPRVGDYAYVLLTGNGSGRPGERQAILRGRYRRDIETNFQTVYTNLPTEPARILGIPFARGGWGFGVEILKRKSPALR